MILKDRGADQAGTARRPKIAVEATLPGYCTTAKLKPGAETSGGARVGTRTEECADWRARSSADAPFH